MSNILKTVGASKMVRKMVGLGVVAAVVAGAFTTSANATPAGLTFYPSTDIYGSGNYHFDSDTFVGKADGTDGDVNFTAVGLVRGFGNDTNEAFGRNEAGVDYLTQSGSLSFGKRLQFNAKSQLFNNEDTRVVAGVWGLGSEDAFSPNVGYLLGSKNFSFGRVHLGVARSFQDEDTVGDDRTNLQVGYDKVFADGKLQFTIDYYTGKTSYSVLAPGLIYYINDKAAVQIGYIKPNDESLFGASSQIYFGFDYNFGGSLDKKAPAEAPAPETSTSSPATQ